jgi:preprotein translocase subunit SecF
MGKFSQLGHDLYTGKKSIDFAGKRWLWYTFSGLIVLFAISGLWLQGLKYGIEFVGGSEIRVVLPADQVTQQTADDLRAAVSGGEIEAAAQPEVATSGDKAILIRVGQLTDEERVAVSDVISKEAGVDPQDLSFTEIGASWGADVARKSTIGLGVFLVAVVLFIWAYFREWKMSIAALVALAHDVLITIGVYAWSTFEVTPATVTGLLTILGFSLYDTVVVFDKVRENTANLLRSHMSYSQAANLAVNQTLVRSINTTLVALIPVAAILYVSVVQLGSGSLKDLALALFVGMAAGAYSSIFIATPFLVQLKEREASSKLAASRAAAKNRKSADRYAGIGALSNAERGSSEMAAPSVTGQAPVVTAGGGAKPTSTADPSIGSGAGSAAAPKSRSVGVKVQPAATPRPSEAPLEESSSAGRVQPSRKPRKKRTRK